MDLQATLKTEKGMLNLTKWQATLQRAAVTTSARDAVWRPLDDGTLIAIDRVAADRPFYSGKHKRHGMNLQVIATPEGDIVWVSPPLRGRVHDIKAARIWGIIRQLRDSGLITLADKGYTGSGAHIAVPYRGRGKPPAQKAANRAHARLRAPGERANAQLKTWRILRKLRCCPWRAGRLAKAIHVLQNRENRG